MKYLFTFLALTTLSVSAIAFVPPAKQTDVYMTTDVIYLKDRWQNSWETTTDCNYRIHEKSQVSIHPISDRIGLDSKLMIKVDGEKLVCRVKTLKLAKQN